MTDRVLSMPTRRDEDRTRIAPRRRPNARPPLPVGVAPPTTRRIRPEPPTSSMVTGALRPWDEPAWEDRADDWDRRADRLQWWMADLGGPHPVSIETAHDREEVSLLLQGGLRRFGVDVIEANTSLLKGLFPPPPEPAPVRFMRWLSRRPIRLEVVEVRLEPIGTRCRVSARASGERAAEALRVALSELTPAPRRPALTLAG